MTHAPTLTVIVLLTLLAPSIAAAEPTPKASPTPSASELSRACFEGLSDASAATCDLCAQAVQQTEGVARVVARANLGRCHEARGELDQALEAFLAARSEVRDETRKVALDERIAAVEAGLAETRAHREEEQPVPPPPTLPASSSSDARPAPLPFWNGERIAGVALFGLGAAGAAVHVATGVAILDRQGEVEDHCTERGDTLTCSPTGLAAAEQGRRLNVVNVVSGVTALAAGSAGLLVWLLAPDQAEALPTLDAGPTGATIGYTLRF